MVNPSPASSAPDAVDAWRVSRGRSAAPAVMKAGNRVPEVNRSTRPPSWSMPTVTGKRRPAARAERWRARLLLRTWSALRTLSVKATTPPRWSPLTSEDGAEVPAYRATMTWPARSRRDSRPTSARARSISSAVGPQPVPIGSGADSEVPPSAGAAAQARGADSSASTSAASTAR